MSIEAVSAVWKYSKQRGPGLLLMLAIADYAKDDGTGAYPSVGKLAAKARLEKRALQTNLARLRDSGELIIRYGEGPNGTNFYDIAPQIMNGEVRAETVKKKTRVQKVAGVQKIAGMQKIARGDAKITTPPMQDFASPPMQDFASNPSVLNVNQPSENPSGESAAKNAAPSPPPPSKSKPVEGKDPTPQQALVGALVDVTGMDARLNGSRLGKTAVQLVRVGATPDDVRRFYGPGEWWYQADWRGQKGEFPRPEQVLETWGQWARAAPVKNGNGHARAAPMSRHERNMQVLEAWEAKQNGTPPESEQVVEGRVIRHG